MKFFWLSIALLCVLEAAPSSVYWTNCTTNVYETGLAHLDQDAYFTVFNRRGHGSTLPTDSGIEVGFLTWKNISFEGGVDYLGGANDPLYFNVGAAIREDAGFEGSPSFKVGLFNVGTRRKGSGRTDQNVVDVILGKSVFGGQFCVAGYSGSRAMGKNRQGFMVSYMHPFCKRQHCDGREYYKWILCGDYASGKNTIGGGGVGIYYYFTPDIDIVTGPVWFNSAKLNGKWKWTVQIDFNFSLFEPSYMTF